VVLARLVHPRQVAHREVRVNAQAARLARQVLDFDCPELGDFLGGQRQRHGDLDPALLSDPTQLALPDDEAEPVGDGPHRFVRGREHVVLLVLHVHETARVVGVVALFGLHERLGFKVGGVRVLGGLGLQELGYDVPAAAGLDHHAPVPQEPRGLGQAGRAVKFVGFLVVAGSDHGVPLGGCSQLRLSMRF
jgi:hypothetical protein